MMHNDKVYIIVLNYNGWADTIECLESLLRLDYANFQVVVVDNYSSDNSIKHIRSWAEGNLNVWVKNNNPLRQGQLQAHNLAVPYVEYRRHDAEKGGNPASETFAVRKIGRNFPFPLILIQNESNLGFAGGNNVGMRYAMNKGDFEFIWLINNDTVVRNDTLTYLVDKVKESLNTGAVGSVHLDYANPDTIQTLGGGRNMIYLGITMNTCPQKSYAELLKKPTISTSKIDFVSGCSILVCKEVLTQVGLLDDEYFVYWEDADWSERIKRRGYLLSYSLKSVVFHKKSQSSSMVTSSYFSTLSCFRFYKKNYPSLIPLIFFTRLFLIFAIGLKNKNFGYIRGSLQAYTDFIKTIFQVSARHAH